MIEQQLERIATALEKIAAGQGMSPAAAPSKPSLPAPSTSKPPATATDKPAAKKPASKPAALPAPAAAEPETEAAEGEITLAVVSEDISALLQANMKPQAVELLAKFGAKSASGVPADKYAEFHEAAAELLESSGLAS